MALGPQDSAPWVVETARLSPESHPGLFSLVEEREWLARRRDELLAASRK